MESKLELEKKNVIRYVSLLLVRVKTDNDNIIPIKSAQTYYFLRILHPKYRHKRLLQIHNAEIVHVTLGHKESHFSIDNHVKTVDIN